MSLIDIDSWITEHDACERLSRDIKSQIVSRNREARLSTEYTKLSGGIRFKLKQFTSQLEQLTKTLNESSAQGKVTLQEAERRQRQIEVLQSKLIHLQTQFTNAPSQESREQLFRSSPYVASGSKLWDDYDDDDAPIQPVGNHTSVHDLRRQQTRILEDQNEGLEQLSKVISRQKHLALRIGDEVEVQNDILDDIAVSMENTDSRVNVETRHIGLITDGGSTKSYWFVIIMLFVAILIVLLL